MFNRLITSILDALTNPFNHQSKIYSFLFYTLKKKKAVRIADSNLKKIILKMKIYPFYIDNSKKFLDKKIARCGKRNCNILFQTFYTYSWDYTRRFLRCFNILFLLHFSVLIAKNVNPSHNKFIN